MKLAVMACLNFDRKKFQGFGNFFVTSYFLNQVSSIAVLKTVGLDYLFIMYVLQQAAYYGMKSSVLQQQLLAVNVNPEKCEATVKAWSAFGKSIVEKLKKHSFVQKQVFYAFI